MSEQKRASVALALCLVSAIVGACWLRYGASASTAWTAFGIACVWTYAADWLGHRLRLLTVPLGRLNTERRKDSNRLHGLARAISLGGNVLLATSLVLAITR